MATRAVLGMDKWIEIVESTGGDPLHRKDSLEELFEPVVGHTPTAPP